MTTTFLFFSSLHFMPHSRPALIFSSVLRQPCSAMSDPGTLGLWVCVCVCVCVCVERCAAGTGRASKTVRANQRPCQPWQAGHTHTHTFSFTFCQVFFSPNFGHVRPLVCVRVCVFHGWSLQMAEVTRLADVPTAWAALSISINLVFVPLFFP